MSEKRFVVRDYDLAATLSCGQAFRWECFEGIWEGVVGSRWVRLRAVPSGIEAETARPETDWRWLENYLQTAVELNGILAAFPQDEPMRDATRQCRGLRLLRQPPWECLASFVLSSTKQIVQIRQVISILCRRYGQPVPVPPGHSPVYSFPAPERVAGLSEKELRECKMGFRARYLLQAARAVAEGRVELDQLPQRSLEEARTQLMGLAGVGPKIADCVLLFSCGFATAFPVDVWMMRALRQHYFPRRWPAPARMRHFISTYFGPQAGYAQQYLFHSIRLSAGRPDIATRTARALTS